MGHVTEHEARAGGSQVKDTCLKAMPPTSNYQFVTKMPVNNKWEVSSGLEAGSWARGFVRCMCNAGSICNGRGATYTVPITKERCVLAAEM